MRKIAIITITILLAVQMLSAIPVEAQTITASDIQLTNLYGGVDVTWVTSEKTTGWVRYSLDTPTDANAMWANDTRDEDITSADERVDSYTHSCMIKFDYTENDTTIFLDIYGGNDQLLNGNLSIVIPPYTTALTEPWIMTGNLSNGITGIPDALVYMNITRGSETSTDMSYLSLNSGDYLFNTGNGIFWDDDSTYIPTAGDIIKIRVNAGPLGEATDTHIVSSTEASANTIRLDLIEMLLSFTLSDLTVTPTAGDTGTEFTFSIGYNATDATGPDSVTLVIDGTEYSMVADSTNYSDEVVYSYTTTIATGGEHEYYVVVEQNDIEVSTASSAAGAPTLDVDDVDDDDDDSNVMLMIGAVVIVLVLVVVLALIMKKKA